MSIVYSFILGAIAGFLGGLFAYRNNVAKLQAKESEGKRLLDALKGK